MGLTKEPLEVPFGRDDSSSKSVEGGKKANNHESNKLLFKKTQPWKVYVGVGMVKKHILQVTISDDLV